jgi:rubrerythrin
MMRFDSLKDLLTFAIRKEHNARELYLMFRDMVRDPGAKTLLEDLAKQELGHKNMLESALRTGRADRIGGKREVQDLHLSDHAESEDIGPDSSPQDVMLFAMKMERAAHELYSNMLENYHGTELEGILSQLVKEELRHKELLEREYEEHFMMWM